MAFEVLLHGKNGKYWVNTEANTARFFDNRTFDVSDSEWSADDFKGRVGGRSSDLSYREWTSEDVAKDFAMHPNKWKPYEVRYNPAFRKKEVVFL